MIMLRPQVKALYAAESPSGPVEVLQQGELPPRSCCLGGPASHQPQETYPTWTPKVCVIMSFWAIVGWFWASTLHAFWVQVGTKVLPQDPCPLGSPEKSTRGFYRYKVYILTWLSSGWLSKLHFCWCLEGL